MTEKRKIRSFRDLEIYELSLKFPEFELYELGSQIRKSAHSVPTNIAEGWARWTIGEYKHFLIYASASIDETTVHLDSVLARKYILKEKHQYFIDRYNTLSKMSHGLIRKLKAKQ